MGLFSRLFGRHTKEKPHKKTSGQSCEHQSPDGRIRLVFTLQNGQPHYSVEKDGKEIVRPSRLGFEFRGQPPFGDNLEIVRHHSRGHDETWPTFWGEESEIHNNYNEIAVYLEEKTEPGRLFTLRFRVFNDGVAFRYEFPAQNNIDNIIAVREDTEFAIDVNSTAWWIPAYQPDRYEYLYQNTPLFSLTAPVHTPLTIHSTSGSFVSIHEAALYNYGSMNIKLENGKLVSDITPLADGSKAQVNLPFETPWRVLIIAHNAVDLTKSRMVLNLNDPPNPKNDFSWVKPIKFMGIWWALHIGEMTWASGDRHGANTENTMEYIDACKRLGIPALLLEGWNPGWEGDWMGDGANFDFTSPQSDLDFPRVINYARSQNVQLVAHHETAGNIENYEQQMITALDYLQGFDIHYLKTGYAGSMLGKRDYHHSQLGVKHYQKVVEECAKRQIMLDVHEPIKGTGIERTWPNLMVREGARGQEYEGGGITPEHFTVLPFTRMLAGSFDMTPGLFDLTNSVKRVTSTLARQLAFYVTIFSPMEMVSGRPRYYDNNPAFKFIQDVPTTWEKSVPLLGEVGDYFVIARKDLNSPNWFVGGITDENARTINLYLDFLEPEVEYIAEIHKDAPDTHFRDNPLAIDINEQHVRSSDSLNIFMAAGGGFAIRIRPALAH